MYRAWVPPTTVPRSGRPGSAVERLRLLAVCLGLTLAVFAQDAGRVAADTKLDLVVDPARFLQRALTLWDPNGSAGQLQDQAYGYLFPMGPFFLLGKLMALPPWVIQRSWETAIVLTAFLGVVRLARELGIETFWARVAAGLAYGLAPRMLTELFSISAELLPVAVAPWVLLPLVSGSRAGSTRRAAARSGIALLFAGGINASATLAILPIPALWLLTRQRGPRRASLLRWWALAVTLASMWWAVALLLLGRYSPPFLNWIESSAVTTSQNSLLAVLRGVDHWQAYLGPSVWAAGWTLVVVPAAVFATAAVAALGIAGLGRSDTDHRLFYCSCLLLGLVLLTFGHVAELGPPFAQSGRDLLDGPLNAFRNVHKFDPLVRLPLALGVGHLLARFPVAGSTLARLRLPLGHPKPLAVLSLLALGAMAVGPAFGGRMVPQARTVADPVWWSDTAQWLTDHGAGGRALILPGAGRPNMIWGQTVDDPMQPVATSPWNVRDALPLAQPGYIRLLDSMEQLFARGERNQSAAKVLVRSGIKYVVVRNDLDTSSANATRLSYLHTTLDNSPDFHELAHFGPEFGGSEFSGQLADGGLGGNHPAVQIYAVAGYRGMVSLVPMSNAVVATGSADSLPSLVDRGLGVTTPVVFGPSGAEIAADDALTGGTATTARAALTSIADDGIRRREIPFGVPGVAAATMSAGQPFTTRRAAHDYLPSDPGPLTAFRYTGFAGIETSSSASNLSAPIPRGPATDAFSAIDGDRSTAWVSSSYSGAVDEWLRVDFDSPVDPTGTFVAFDRGLGDYPSRIRVRTDAGVLDSDVASDDGRQPLLTPTGPTRHLQLTVLRMASGTRGSAIGISDLTVPGVQPGRTLDVPISATPSVLAFDASSGNRNECLSIDGSAFCDPVNASLGEEDAAIDRSFRLPTAQSYHVAATIRMRASTTLDTMLDRTRTATATATSVLHRDARVRAGAAVDGELATTWTAASSDEHPALTVTFPRPQRVQKIRIRTASAAPVSRATDIVVSAGRETWRGRLPRDGVVRLASPSRTGALTIEVTAVQKRYSTDSQSHAAQLLPTGISEVTILGTDIAPRHPSGTVSFGCGAGMYVEVDGRRIPFRAAPTISDAEAGLPTLAVPCGSDLVDLAAGAHRMRLVGGSLARPDSLTATAEGTASLGRGSAEPVTVTHWGATDRSVRFGSGPRSIVVVRENANPGWQATVNGKRLVPLMVDGWQQGFVLPAHSAGVVDLRFLPQRTFAAGLVFGAGCAALLILLACYRRPRSDEHAGLGDGTASRGWILGGVLVAGFLLLGTVGTIVAAAVLALGAVAVRRPRAGWVYGAVVLGLIAVLAALFPPGSTHAVSDLWFVQLLCLSSVLAAVLLPVAPSTWPGRRPRRSSRRSIPNHDTAATPVAAAAVSTKSVQK